MRGRNTYAKLRSDVSRCKCPVQARGRLRQFVCLPTFHHRETFHPRKLTLASALKTAKVNVVGQTTLKITRSPNAKSASRSPRYPQGVRALWHTNQRGVGAEIRGRSRNNLTSSQWRSRARVEVHSRCPQDLRGRWVRQHLPSGRLMTFFCNLCGDESRKPAWQAPFLCDRCGHSADLREPVGLLWVTS